MRNIEILPTEDREKFDIRIDYIIIRCNICENHWGVSLANRGSQVITVRDLICQKCAADLRAKEV